MIFHGSLKGFAVRERRVDADFITQWTEMLHDVANDDIAWVRRIFIESDADVNIRRIAAQQIGAAWETVAVYK